MGVHDTDTMNYIRKALDQIDPTITMHGEPWSADTCALDYSLLANKESIIRMPRIAAFGNELRDAVLGTDAWLAGRTESTESVKFGIVGGISHPQVNMQHVNYCHSPWAQQPTQHISYVSCHDGLCLFDHLRARFPRSNLQTLLRLDMLAQTPILLSQGIPFLYAGEEVLRTKYGESNSYQSPDLPTSFVPVCTSSLPPQESLPSISTGLPWATLGTTFTSCSIHTRKPYR